MVQDSLGELKACADAPLTHARGAPKDIYLNQDIADREQTQIFKNDWICAGWAAEIPKAGDYLTLTIADEPIICIRSKKGEVEAYSNVCRHRMMRLLEGEGNVSRITCPYHAWTYGIDGRLAAAPHMDRTQGFNKQEICLPRIRTEIWHGWIYVTLNDNAPPIESLLKPLDKMVAKYDMASYVPVVRQHHVWNCNWKVLTENFMEGYHLPVAHRATLGAWFPADDVVFPAAKNGNFTYQIFPKNDDAVYGLAHRDNKKLRGKWRKMSVMPTIFPSHMYVLAPDHLWYLSLIPEGTDHVRILFGASIAPEVDATIIDRDQWITNFVAFFEAVNAEDRGVVESIYSNMRAGKAVPGPLSWMEEGIHDFQGYLADRLAGKSG